MVIEKEEAMSDTQKVPMEQHIAEIWTSTKMAEHWQRGAEQRKQVMAAATERLIDLAALQPGDHVLDIAAGTGDQGRLAAKRVGPTGLVLITDISAQMLAIAARLAEQEGLSAVQTRVMNAEQLELEENSFDAVICRHGLEAVPRLQQALGEIRRVLKPGKRFVVLTWSLPERNPLIHFFAKSSVQFAQKRSSSVPTPFAFSERPVLEREFREAGFQEVFTEVLPLCFRYPSLEAFLQSSQGEMRPGPKKSAEELQQRLEEMRSIFEPYEGPNGLEIPGEALLGVAVK